MSEIIEQLEWRYATKEFNKEKQLSESQLHTLKRALQLSPSSFGLQAWKFIIVSDQDTKNKLLPLSWNQSQVTDASHIIVFARPTHLHHDDVDHFISHIANERNVDIESLSGYADVIKSFISKKSDEELAIWMEKQIYIALGFLLATCASEGIDSCPMEGFDRNGYDDVLNLSDDNLSSVVVCPVGFRSDNDAYAARKKVRFPEDQLFIEK